jgi:outer membrane lipoprotein-sorting protein
MKDASGARIMTAELTNVQTDVAVQKTVFMFRPPPGATRERNRRRVGPLAKPTFPGPPP